MKKKIIRKLIIGIFSKNKFDVTGRLKTSIVIGEIIGDMKKVSVINTQLITILKQESKAGELLTSITDTIKKVKFQHKYEDLAYLYSACLILYLELHIKISHNPFHNTKELGGELALKVNNILNGNSIDYQVSENLSDIIDLVSRQH